MNDCSPKRQDYDNVKDFFKAIQKCNEDKAKRNATQSAEIPEGCNNELIQDKDEHDAGDILLKFILENGTNHCMYVSEFKKYIQNICNLYTEWTCIDKTRCSDSGTGYTPMLQAFDLLGILKFTNHCCVIDPLYWQVPIFSKGFLTMKTILEIQQKIEDAGTKSEVEINIKEDRKSGETFRTGNIYGTFGIGQSHAQKEDTLFYVLTESSDASEECSIKPDKGLFNFEGMATKLSLQLEIKDAVNQLYQKPMDLTREPWNEFFLTDKIFKEEHLCPDTETVIDVFFSYYNNEILIPAGTEGTVEKITENMTLIKIREIINKNQIILEEQNKDKINASIVVSTPEDIMNVSDNSPINSFTPVRSSPRIGALFTGSPMSPINGSLLDTSIRSDYDFALGNESTYIDRSPISPLMRSLHMSDFANTPTSAEIVASRHNTRDHDYFGSLQGDNVATTLNFDPHTTPGQDGGKNTFNRKKKPRKTKKRKRTKKYNKKIRRKISIKK